MRSALSARAWPGIRPMRWCKVSCTDREAFDRQLMHEIDAYAPDLVVLAGYMPYP